MWVSLGCGLWIINNGHEKSYIIFSHGLWSYVYTIGYKKLD